MERTATGIEIRTSWTNDPNPFVPEHTEHNCEQVGSLVSWIDFEGNKCSALFMGERHCGVASRFATQLKNGCITSLCGCWIQADRAAQMDKLGRYVSVNEYFFPRPTAHGQCLT